MDTGQIGLAAEQNNRNGNTLHVHAAEQLKVQTSRWKRVMRSDSLPEASRHTLRIGARHRWPRELPLAEVGPEYQDLKREVTVRETLKDEGKGRVGMDEDEGASINDFLFLVGRDTSTVRVVAHRQVISDKAMQLSFAMILSFS